MAPASTPPRLFVGLDIGGTKIEAILFDGALRERARVRGATVTTSPDALLARTVALVGELLHRAGASRADLALGGVGIPGQVIAETGEVRLAANLHLTAFPLGAALTAELGLPVVVENDVRAAAFGAARLSPGSVGENLAYVNVGTGLSAGLILGGTLYRGSSGMAGEIGHLVFDPDGPRCNCGAQGCLETLVAGPAIARAGREAVASGAETALRDLTPLTAEAVYYAAGEGDPVAQAITDRAGAALGRALQGLVMSYDVARIILGGGVTRAGDLFLRPILREWARQGAESPLARAMLRPAMLQLAPPGQNLVAAGAAALAASRLPPGPMAAHGQNPDSSSFFTLLS